MPDPETTAAARAVFAEPRASVSSSDASTTGNVTPRPLETVKQGRGLRDDLQKAARPGLRGPPTMWR